MKSACDCRYTCSRQEGESCGLEVEACMLLHYSRCRTHVLASRFDARKPNISAPGARTRKPIGPKRRRRRFEL